MIFIFFFTIIVHILKLSSAENECLSPWEKIDDNICLLLNSQIKTWNHAKISCNFYGGDLLYVNNQQENQKINDFIDTLLRYRFNLKPYAWLGAVKNSDNWLWYHNNQSVIFSNWLKNFNSDQHCSCFHLRGKFWQSCDCGIKQHFICRKTDKSNNEFLPKSRGANLPFVVEKKKLVEKNLDNMNNELTQEEKSIIVSSLILMKDDDSLKTEEEAKPQLLVQDDMKILENMKKNSGFMRDPNLFVNIFRTKIAKNSILFTLYDCKYGFGYYAVDNDCAKYKICENWDNKYAILTLNKCVYGKVFSFEKLECVNRQENFCDPNSFVPV